MNILKRIQLLCKEAGINPSNLEVELGFGKGTLYKWNNGMKKVISKLVKEHQTRNPIKIADHLGIIVLFEEIEEFKELTTGQIAMIYGCHEKLIQLRLVQGQVQDSS